MAAEIEYRPAPEDAFPPRPPSYLEQNYTMHVFRDVADIPGNDILAAAHPNGIAFLTLAPSHAALRQAGLGDTGDDAIDGDTAVRLAFELPEPPAERGGGGGRGGGRGGHRKGKKNKAADVYFAPGQKIARLLCGESGEDGQQEWVLASPLRGRLVEANAALEGLQGVELLKALRDGYLAVLEVKTGAVGRAAAEEAVAVAVAAKQKAAAAREATQAAAEAAAKDFEEAKAAVQEAEAAVAEAEAAVAAAAAQKAAKALQTDKSN